MQESLEASLVRIRTSTGQIVGAGFLVGACQVLTCAHVVAAALDLADDTPEKPRAPLTLDFPCVAPGQLLTAHVVLWRPPRADGGDDIAGLELDSDPPPGAQAAPLAQVDDLWEHSFRVFGFPQGEDTGVWATGRLLGRQGTNWVQIEDVKEAGFAVEPGFSGTPVWDPQVEAMVGMVVAAEKRLNLKTAFAIPVDVLAGSWPLLASLIHPFVFLSYARADSELVTRLKTDLQSQGIQVWIDREGLQPGTLDWEEALRTAIRASQVVLLVASPSARSSRYVRDELRIAEMYQRPVYPFWIAGSHWMDAIPLGWGTAQYIDARESHYETAISELVELLNKASSTPAQPSEPDFVPRNPYKGLRAFTSDDAQDFFGRDTLINELATKLQGTLASETKDQQSARLLAVVGPSGSGKSSVVMAGLLPRLRAGRLPGSEQWVYLDPIVPGTRPIEELTMTLSEHLPDKSLKAIREDLEDDSARGLHLLSTKLAKRPGTKMVLLIDQFEELFTQTPTEDERRHFIDLLVTAATETNGPLIVLLTLRADFYDRPMRYPLLHQLMQAHQTSVLPMTLQDLREVIEKPAALPDVRLTFEGDLVGDLLFEVQNQIGVLPLLQFTLDQLFQHCNGCQLTLASYRELGGVKGALTKQAEETYNVLPSDEHRKLARALFMRLMDPGASEQDTTRRRAALSEFSLTESSQTLLLQKVADAFITARLLTTNEIAGTTTIEVSHEALIREWPRLAGWLREARDDIRLQQAISEDATEWEQHNKPGDRLYRGIQLKEAQDWARRNSVSQQEHAFLQASAVGQVRSLIMVMLGILLIVTTSGIAGWLALHQPAKDGYVITTDEYAIGSLRWAIGTAHPGDTITFAPSLLGRTIILHNADLHIFQQNLIIRGPSTGQIIIQEIGAGVVVDPPASVTIDSLIFRGSQASNQPTLIQNQGKLALKNCVVTGNTSRSLGSPTLASGGGIFNSLEGSMTLTNSIVSDNNNKGGFDGGGIHNEGSMTLMDSMISNNTSNGAGGGIESIGDMTLMNSTISGNKASDNGGGIESIGNMTLMNSTISGNIARYGGGLYIQSFVDTFPGQVNLAFSTIYGNIARYGSDIAVEDLKEVNSSFVPAQQISQISIRNGIVVGDPTHPGPDIVGRLMSYGYNLLEDNSGAAFDPATSMQHHTDKTLSTNDLTKLFADSAKLQNNGGPTKTLALAPNSPAIDQIPLAACHAAIPPISNDFGTPVTQQYSITTDQRGRKRPDDNEDMCDIGAYESSY